MNKKTLIPILSLIILIFTVTISNAQRQPFLGVTDVPPNESNNRFYNDISAQLNRPALSVVGFDNNGDHSKGYGLRQILNQAYNFVSNEQKEMIINMLNIANETIVLNPTTREHYQTNSNILQYRAFEALASYVLEQNGVNPSSFGIPMRNHAAALAAFKDDILALASAGKLANVLWSDYVKELRTFSNIARALDLYLALENAYKYWDYAEWNNPTSQVLLTSQQKFQLFGHFNDRLLALGAGHVFKNVPFIGPEHKFEPGNRPLKGFMVLGYSSLATVNVGVDNYQRQEIQSWRFTAREAGSSPFIPVPIIENRDHKWMHQSDNGKRFWAEGQYYFNFALMDVVPFWHAVRANNLLGNVSDPFHNSWFLNPVEWLADTSTPDGLTAPINDGNKHTISATPLLRWSPVYGNGTVGSKFQSIFETKEYYKSLTSHPQQQVYVLGNHTWLLELAIPKATSSIPIEYHVSDSEEEQLIIRYRDGHNRLHYVYLNAEGHTNIVRGEGHQQPDNMSLLYYVNDVSYVMSTGYDEASFCSSILPWNSCFPAVWTKSSWNNYTDQNVTMIAQPVIGNDILNPGNPDSGMKYPKLDLLEERVVSDHQPVDTKAFISQNNLTVIFSQTDLETFDEAGDYKSYADYFRFALFVNDADRPYLIDMNFGYPLSSAGFNQQLQFRTTYHINSNNLLFTPQYDQFALFTDIGQYSDRYLFVKPTIVERAPILSNNEVIQNSTAMEFFKAIRPEHPIKKLNIYSQGPDEFPNGMVHGYTGVAFIEALTDLSAADAQNKTFLYNNKLPEARFSYPTGIDINAHQAWTWQRSENIIDLLIVRSGFAFNPHQSTAPSPSTPLTMNGFSFSPLINITLDENKAFGFVRFVKDSGEWLVDSNFKLNLEAELPPIQAPENITITNAGTYSSPMLEWDAHPNPNIDHYQVWRQEKRNSDGFQFDPVMITTTSSTTYTDWEISQSPNTSSDWRWRVRAVTNDNEFSLYSNYTYWLSGFTFFSIPEDDESPETEELPDSFKFFSAYPNPFNPSTNISFELPEQSHVRLHVYDIIGRQVAQLENGFLDAGRWNRVFDASQLASGFYIARLQVIGSSGQQHIKDLKIQLVK